jgi:hypothetical protein
MSISSVAEVVERSCARGVSKSRPLPTTAPAAARNRLLDGVMRKGMFVGY